MYTMASSFYLPDLLSLSKSFKGSTNPHYRKAAAESRAWVNSYNIFTDRKRAFFVQGCNELLVSHTYPHAGYEEFRTICDFVNLLFVVDEVSDDQNGADARSTGEVYLNAMKYPGWTDGSPLAKMTGQYVLALQLLLFTSDRHLPDFAHASHVPQGLTHSAVFSNTARTTLSAWHEKLNTGSVVKFWIWSHSSTFAAKTAQSDCALDSLNIAWGSTFQTRFSKTPSSNVSTGPLPTWSAGRT